MIWTSEINEIVAAYQKHLEQNYNFQYQKSFNDLLYKNNEEAAISEAIVFNWLCQNNFNPQIQEDKSKGGADFICNYSRHYKFVVEVTCLGREELTKATGLHINPGQYSSPKTPVEMFRRRVSSKAAQLASYEMPRVLVITSLHDGANFLFRSDAAVEYLVSKYEFITSLDINDINIHLTTDLQEAIFTRPSDNSSEIEYCRESISAILLISISGNQLFVSGILHPKPSYPLNFRIFPKIPFLTIKGNVTRIKEIVTEWVIAEPDSTPFMLYPRI
jgi:hypothetical protein